MTELIKFNPENLSHGFDWVVFACCGDNNEVVMHGPFVTHTDATEYVCEHNWPGEIFVAKIETKGKVGTKTYFDPIDL